MNYLRRHGEIFLLALLAAAGGLWGIARAFPPMSAGQQIFLLLAFVVWTAGFAYCVFKSEFPWFRRYKVEIALTLLVLYVVSLALVTISELFDLGWFAWL